MSQPDPKSQRIPAACGTILASAIAEFGTTELLHGPQVREVFCAALQGYSAASGMTRAAPEKVLQDALTLTVLVLAMDASRDDVAQSDTTVVA